MVQQAHDAIESDNLCKDLCGQGLALTSTTDVRMLRTTGQGYTQQALWHWKLDEDRTM